jgi:hypothetical protein
LRSEDRVSNRSLDEEPGQDAFSGPAEAWEPWETTLVLLSLALGVAGLLLLGWLVNHFILP